MAAPVFEEVMVWDKEWILEQAPTGGNSSFGAICVRG